MTQPAVFPPSDELVPGLATQANRPHRFLAVALMTLAALFSGVVLGVMLVAYFEEVGPGYPTSAVVKELRAILDKEPKNEALKAALRNEDARMRAAFDTRRLRLQAGAWMLLVGLVVFTAAGRWYLSLDRSLPNPRKAADELAGETRPETPRARAWIALSLVAVVALGVLLGAGYLLLPGSAARKPGPPPVTFKDNWPSFRGPSGTGLVASSGYPTEWDGKTGHNVLWKTQLPLAGKSSPVLWGGKVFVTAADRKEQKVICLDRETGRVLWEQDIKSLETVARVAKGDADDLSVFQDTGWAAPTPVTDGTRVYALFASADVAAVDFDGKIVWVKNFGTPQSQYSLSASLALFKDTVIFQFDQGSSAEDKLSALYALDTATGNVVWKTERPVGASWCSPIVAETPKGPLIITAGVPWVIEYEPSGGTELWRANGLGGDLAPSPVYADGTVFVTGDRAKAMAIRADGTGDVTSTNILWTSEEGLSDASSPLTDGKLFVQATSGGLVTCSSAADGKTAWDHQFPTAFWASPALVGELVYLCGEDGATRIFKLAGAFELTRENPLGETVHASPAFGDGRIFIRGAKHLFCIGTK